jgi:hypothetical protein
MRGARDGRRVGSSREERIHHRQLLVKDLAVLQVLAIERVTAGKQR